MTSLDQEAQAEPHDPYLRGLIAQTPRWTPIPFEQLRVGDSLEWNTSYGGLAKGTVTRLCGLPWGPWIYLDSESLPRDEDWLCNRYCRVRRQS